MNGSLKTISLSATLLVLLIVGCTHESVLDPAVQDAEEVFLVGGSQEAGEPGSEAASKFFTGRDSFGVALKAKVSGSLTHDSQGGCSAEYLAGDGEGRATHMGIIAVVQEHCFDPATLEFSEGSFTFTGKNGTRLSGRYNGTLEPVGSEGAYTIHGKFWVESGAVPAAAQPAEGRGTITGMLYPDGAFTYELDGWLLHHVRE